MRLTTNYFDDEEERERRQWELDTMERYAGGPSISMDVGDFFASEAPVRSAMEAAPPDPEMERMHRAAEIPRTAMTPADYEQDALRAVRDSYQREAQQGAGFWADFLSGGEASRNRERAVREVGERQLALSDSQARQVHNARQRELQERGYSLDEQGQNLRAQEIANERARIEAMGRPDPMKELQKQKLEIEIGQMKDPNYVTAAQREANADRDEARAQRQHERQIRQHERETQQRELAEVRDRQAMSEFMNRTKEATAIAKQLQRAEPVIASYQGRSDMPSAGMWDSSVPTWMDPRNLIDPQRRKDAIDIRQGSEGAQAAFRYLNTGAAAAMGEDKTLRGITGLNAGATEEEFRAGVKQLSELMKKDIRARASAIDPALARRVLDEQGLTDWVFAGQGPGDNPLASPKVQQLYQNGPPQGDDGRSGPVTPGAYWQPGQGQPQPLGGDHRGTPGFPGSADPITTTPLRPKLNDDEQEIRKRLLQGGIDFRWEE